MDIDLSATDTGEVKDVGGVCDTLSFCKARYIGSKIGSKAAAMCSRMGLIAFIICPICDMIDLSIQIDSIINDMVQCGQQNESLLGEHHRTYHPSYLDYYYCRYCMW